jgi:bifunctional DNase/RNase
MTDAEPQSEVRMEIKGLMLDPTSNVPIVILRDEAGRIFLPIWIGVFEANAIALRLESVETPRPMTHDLLRSAIETIGAKVSKIVISDLRDNTFYAQIHVQTNGTAVEIDARPSDAIALALRTESPIFVLQPVLDKAQAVDLATQATDEEKLKKWLEEISPEDLGKYEM